MGHQDMCMPWREMLAGQVTTTTMRSRIIQLNLPEIIIFPEKYGFPETKPLNEVSPKTTRVTNASRPPGRAFIGLPLRPAKPLGETCQGAGALGQAWIQGRGPLDS